MAGRWMCPDTPSQDAGDMNRHRLLRLSSALLLGLAFGALCARLETFAAAGTGLVHHLAGVGALTIGSWWAWAVFPALVTAGLMRSVRRHGEPGRLLSVVCAWLVLPPALAVHELLAPSGGDLTSLAAWAAATLPLALVMGLLGWCATAATPEGTLVRVLLPLAMVVEVLVAPSASLLEDSLAWRDLVARLAMVGVGTLWAIIALARGRRSGVPVAPHRIEAVPAA